MKKPNMKKVTGKALLTQVALPVGCAALGSIAGSAAGKTWNLALAAGLGALGLAMGQPNLIYAGAGAAVVTPSPASVSPMKGLDGFKDNFLTAKNRALGQTKALLTNTRVLAVVADKIPVSGLMGLGETDAYEMGYVEGVSDTVDEYGGEVAGLEGGFNFGAALPGGRISVEALQMQQM